MSIWDLGKSLVGGLASHATNIIQGAQIARDRQQNIDMQYEFAKNGIRWRAEDAAAAGISPLAALGAGGASFSPIYGTGSTQTSGGDLSQYLGRAVDAVSGDKERVEKLQDLNVERSELENTLLRSRIAQLNSAQLGPALPGSPLLMDGQGNSSIVDKPMERTMSMKGRPASEPGASPDYGWARTDTGVTRIPSKDVKERIEDQFVPETLWAIRNNLIPTLKGGGEAPPRSMLPKWADTWTWSPGSQEWQPSTRKEESSNSLSRQKKLERIFQESDMPYSDY